MLSDFVTIKNWPRDEKGDPIFASSEDAVFYAQLIFRNRDECFNMVRLRILTRKSIDKYKSYENPNLDEMMNLAVKGQFIRECLEEILKMRNELAGKSIEVCS